MRRGQQLLTSINVHSFQLPCAINYRNRLDSVDSKQMKGEAKTKPIENDTYQRYLSPPPVGSPKSNNLIQYPMSQNTSSNKAYSIYKRRNNSSNIRFTPQHKRADTLARLESTWGKVDYDRIISMRSLKWDSFQYYMSKNSPWARAELWESLSVEHCDGSAVPFPDMP